MHLWYMQQCVYGVIVRSLELAANSLKVAEHLAMADFQEGWMPVAFPAANTTCA